MAEIVVALLVVAAVGLVGLLATALSPSFIVTLGLATLAAGLLLGVPTGFWYHVLIYRLAAAQGPVPARWWLRPSALHAGLTEAELRPIMRWYRIGGAGFVLSVAGGLVAIAGFLLAWR